MPRMTTAERTAIATPASGLQVYDTTTNTQWYYNGTDWVEGASADMASKWTNDTTNSLVKLTNLSDGATTRPVGSEFVVNDGGKVSIGRSSTEPSLKFQVSGNDPSLAMGVVSYSDATLTSGTLVSTGGIAAGVSPSSNGVGTLHLRSAIGTTPYIQFTEDGIAFQGQIGFKSGSNDFVVQTSGATFQTGSEKFRIKANGNVGIGNTNPSEKLVIDGAITIGNTSTAAPVAGTIKFDGTNFMGWNGTQWVQLN